MQQSRPEQRHTELHLAASTRVGDTHKAGTCGLQELCRRCIRYNASCGRAWECLGAILEREQAYKVSAQHVLCLLQLNAYACCNSSCPAVAQCCACPPACGDMFSPVAGVKLHTSGKAAMPGMFQLVVLIQSSLDTTLMDHCCCSSFHAAGRRRAV